MTKDDSDRLYLLVSHHLSGPITIMISILECYCSHHKKHHKKAHRDWDKKDFVAREEKEKQDDYILEQDIFEMMDEDDLEDEVSHSV